MTPTYCQSKKHKHLKSIEDVFNFKMKPAVMYGAPQNQAKENREFMVRGAQSRLVEAPKVL